MSDTPEFEISFCRSLLNREPEDLGVMEMLAHYCTRAGHIEEGLKLDQRIVQLNPANPITHYNLACSLALLERHSEAVAALRRALELGYRDFRWLHKDPDLASLHPDPAFSALIAEFQNNH